MDMTEIILLIVKLSTQNNIDPNTVLAVAKVESGFNMKAVSKDGHDYGVFQLRDSSFPNYTKEQLLDPAVNTKLAIEYMAKLKKSCKHKNNNEWLTCWNTGPAYANKIKHPSLFPYVKKINKLVYQE